MTVPPSPMRHRQPSDDGMTRVELTWIEKRIEHWIRFGRVAVDEIVDRRRRIVRFRPGAVFAFVGVYNRLVAAAEKATGAWNELDSLLRQRHDEIPKIIEMCEPYLRGDRTLLDRLLEARAAVFAARQTRDAESLGRAELALRAAATALMARAAAQPELVASPAFSLQRQRQATLDLELKDRRDRYNESVREYNAAIGGRGLSGLVALVGSFPPLRPLDFESAGS